MPGQLVRDPSELRALEEGLPWYCETRQGLVKRPPELAGEWAVGPYEGRVRWLFETRADQRLFVGEIGLNLMLVVGYLGPVETETKTWR